MTQPIFSYRAVSKDGSIISGVLPGDNDRQVVLSLQKKGLVPLEVYRGDGPAPRKVRSGLTRIGNMARVGNGGLRDGSIFHRRATTRTLSNFAENLSMLLGAGISLDKSLHIVSEMSDSARFREVVTDLHNRIREGSGLGDALAQHPGTFPPVFVSMVTAGERGGILESVLDKLVDYLKNVQELRAYLVSAMIYPALLTITSVVSVVVLLTVVMPRFAVIFEDLGAAVPLTAQIMLAAGGFLQSWWWLLLTASVLLIAALWTYSRTPSGRLSVDGLKLRLPLIGPILAKVEVARFARTLGTLLTNGVPILSALNIVRGVIQNRTFREHLNGALQDIKDGGLLSEALAREPYVPSLAVHMVRVGEQTGRLDIMLGKVADAFDKDLRASIRSFTSLFEPVIILVLGLIIGGMVISILTAIFSINQLGV